MLKTPAGRLHFFAAVTIAAATNSQVPGCAGCALNTTGQPAASALTVSPPAVENAKGKLLAPNTATGPNGTCICRRSGLGAGTLSGSAVSMMAFTQLPSLNS